MEATTCEQYVLQELAVTKTQLDNAERDVVYLRGALADANFRVAKLEQLIAKRSKISDYSTGDNSRVIDFDEPWEKYDKEDFDLVVECMSKYPKED